MPKGVKGFQVGHSHSEETRRKIGNSNRKAIFYACDQCGKECVTSPAIYKKKKRHFCSMQCYSAFVQTLPFWEHNAYQGIRNPGETKQVYHQRNCANNPKTIQHLKARRYARERGAEGSHSLKEWEDLKDRHNNRCLNCGEEKPLTKDHILPLSEGGTEFIDNIQPLCRNCNSKKWKHVHDNPDLLDAK